MYLGAIDSHQPFHNLSKPSLTPAVPPAPWALPPRTLASQPAGVHGATANPHVEHGLALVQGMSVQHLTITIAMDSN